MVTELGESIPDDELREMIEEADRDADGFVVFDDFYRIMKKPSDSDEVRVDAGPGLCPPRPFLFCPLAPLTATRPTRYAQEDD